MRGVAFDGSDRRLPRTGPTLSAGRPVGRVGTLRVWLRAPFEDRRLRVPTSVGLLGALVAVVAGAVTRPAGGESLLVPLWGTPRPSPGNPFTSSVCLVGVGAVVAAWLAVLRVVRAGPRRTPLPAVLGVWIWWTVPFAVGPALFSRDVFSYAAQGEVAARGLDPYANGAVALGPDNPFVAFVDPIWRRTPTPYGPLWVELCSLFARAFGHRPLLSVLALRLVALASLVVIAWCLVRMARRHGVDPSLVLVIGVCNPLMLLHGASGAHNEVLLVALVLLGMELAADGRLGWAVTLCALAASIKVPAFAAVVFLGWAAAGSDATWRRRLLDVAWVSALGVAVMAALAWATGLGWGWVATLQSAGGSKSLMAPLRAAGVAVGTQLRDWGVAWSDADIRTLTALAGIVVAMALSFVILTRVRDRVPVVSLGLALLVVTVLGPALYPWYLLPAICLLAFARRPHKVALAVGVSVATAVLILPSGAGVLYRVGPVGPWIVPVMVLAAVVGVLWWRTAGRSRSEVG